MRVRERSQNVSTEGCIQDNLNSILRHVLNSTDGAQRWIRTW